MPAIIAILIAATLTACGASTQTFNEDRTQPTVQQSAPQSTNNSAAETPVGTEAEDEDPYVARAKRISEANQARLDEIYRQKGMARNSDGKYVPKDFTNEHCACIECECSVCECDDK